jgi:hypothetical protein
VAFCASRKRRRPAVEIPAGRTGGARGVAEMGAEETEEREASKAATV